ncbi:PEGA domain-containing protein [Sorangium sp. So ce375]|uniref:PEGA domain-containing protein n=1 Tax=Sorangium sp. So ce375 TaxID=3133306 RepID=UPI003F5C8BDB
MAKNSASRNRTAILHTILLVSATGNALAQPANAPAPPPDPDSPTPVPPAAVEDQSSARAEAEARFYRGKKLADDGAWNAALAEFLASRELYPGSSATIGAAVCLKHLQRFDEALDLFEILLRDFSDSLSADVKASAQREAAELRSLIGTIVIQRVARGAAITLNGRSRGVHPSNSSFRVPAGSHILRVDKEGFEPFETRVTVAGGQTVRVDVLLTPLAIRLRRQQDEDDAELAAPHRPAATAPGEKAGTFSVEAAAGYAFASSLESDAERSCGSFSCSGISRPSGVLAGVRGSYEFPIGAAIELTAGYLRLHTSLDRSLDATYAAPDGSDERLPIRYSFHDDILMAGVTVIVGGSYHYGLSSWLDVGGALGLGVVLAETRDEVTGTASDAQRTVSVAVQSAGVAVRSAAAFAIPELRLRLRLGHFSASAGLGVGFFLVDGPPLQTGNTYVVGAECDEAHPTVDCAPGKKVVFQELAHGSFTMFLPNVTAGYRF